MPTSDQSSSVSASKGISWLVKNLGGMLLIAVPILLSALLTAALSNVSLWYSTLGSLQYVLHANLGLNEAWAGVVSPILALIYLWGTWQAIRWLFFIRKQKIAAVIGLIVFSSLFPLLHVWNANFNRVTGRAQVCALVRPDGTMDIWNRDANGSCPYTDSGQKTVSLTVDMACYRERQDKGLKPIPFNGDPRQVEFTDPLTGKPRMLYYKEMDGSFRLFAADKYYLCGGDFLRPVTPDIRQAIIQKIDQSEALARHTAEEQKRKSLIGVFASDSYSSGSVIVGVKATESNAVAQRGAHQLQAAVIAALHERGLAAEDFRPPVYESGYFDAMLNGQTSILDEVGLRKKLRAAMFIVVTTSCRQAEIVPGTTSCTIDARTNVLTGASSQFRLGQWSETGAGSNADDAIARAAELLIQRHPEILTQI